MGRARITGNQLQLTVDGVQRAPDCTSVVINPASAGIVQGWTGPITTPSGWQMSVTAVQSTDADALWRLLWKLDEPGDWVAYKYVPHGNTVPTADLPHFTGKLQLMPIGTLGGEAGRNVEYVYSVVLPLDGRPNIITSTSTAAWQASTAYAIDDQVTLSGDLLQCIDPGTSGDSAPNLAGKAIGDNVTDGTVTWTVTSDQT